LICRGGFTPPSGPAPIADGYKPKTGDVKSPLQGYGVTYLPVDRDGLRISRAGDTLVIVIYLDHNATTPILPEVLEAMMPYLTTEWGNPSSAYKFGAKLKSVIETARAQVAELIGAHAPLLSS
jgi:Aminotransferase class-V